MATLKYTRDALLLAALSGLGGCGGPDGISPAEGPPAQLVWRSNAIGTGFVSNVVPPPELRVLNGDGQPLEGVPVEFWLEGEGRLAWLTAFTTSDGYASAGGWRLGASPGVHRLVAEAGELTLTWAVTVTDLPAAEFDFQVSYEPGTRVGPGGSIALAFTKVGKAHHWRPPRCGPAAFPRDGLSCATWAAGNVD